ncbi:MAG: glycosyltransferase family 9 protein [Bryobacteraceae bacterium]
MPESTSCKEDAQALLDCCLRAQPWPAALLDRLTQDDCSRELFRVVIEGLADRFDPALCEVYNALFIDVLRRAGLPALRPHDQPPPLPDSVARVYVLSRVTLGADVAITSVLLDAVKHRFPRAGIFLAGSRKSWELFERDPRIAHLEIPYPRGGSLSERLTPWQALGEALVGEASALVVDSDSRITQLGLLPVCPNERYFFFPSRSYGGYDDESLGALVRRWAKEVFGVEAGAYIAPWRSGVPEGAPLVTVSIGVGENAAKRIGGPFEARLLGELAARGATIYIDKGAGGEETERVERAIAQSGAPAGSIHTWQGAFAPFASAIAQSNLYVGYDSAGQHVAAACGVPLVSIFAGFPSQRMFARWRPMGSGPIEVVRVDDPEPALVLEQTLAAVARLGIAV